MTLLPLEGKRNALILEFSGYLYSFRWEKTRVCGVDIAPRIFKAVFFEQKRIEKVFKKKEEFSLRVE